MRIYTTAVLALVMAISTQAFAADKEYQVTGPVLEDSAASIVVQKGSQRWELAKNGSTKTTGTVAVGSKVTVYYTMTATSIESKAKTEKKKK